MKAQITLRSTDYIGAGSTASIPIRRNGFWRTLWCFLIRKPSQKEEAFYVVESVDSSTTITISSKN